MRRFYKAATVEKSEQGYAVHLDGKPVKTPLGAVLHLPSRLLAEHIAAEWAAQGESLKPETMPLTRLAQTMTDKAAGADRAAINAELLKYGGSDLVCYFATHPEDLVKRQEELWRPLLGWMEEKHGISFEAVSGIRYKEQSPDMLKTLSAVMEHLDAGAVTVVQAATAATGSVVIALALQDGRLSPEEAFAAAAVDDIYQLENWGEDEAARARLEALRAELGDIALFRDLLSASS